MRDCIDCKRWAASPGSWRMFDPACLECGGRYLACIQRTAMGKQEKQAWLRKALADWMAYGHDEKQLRALAQQRR